jgi:CRP/FNR family transcriptional regulator, cyclic AMP receptor protein
MIIMRDLLREHPFLAGLPEPWIELLSNQAVHRSWPSGQRLFEEGGQADRFWLIRRGTVSLDHSLRETLVVETLGPGTVLGWSWLFPPYRWHFGAVVVEQTQAIELDAGNVRRRCEKDPALGYELSKRFMAVMLDRLQSTRNRLLGQESPR